MRFGSLNGRAVILSDAGTTDIGHRSNELFSSSLDELVPILDRVEEWYWANRPDPTDPRTLEDLQANVHDLSAPLIRSRQIFAIGLNYQSHADESKLAVPSAPMVFTKFASAISGPGDDVRLPEGKVDWEVELVAVIGRGGREIARADALKHVAAYCVGQDISERKSQLALTPPQFSLAKSHQGFAPIGPWLTPASQIPDPMDLAITCKIDEDIVQLDRTKAMMFDISYLIEYLSSVCELFPGDLIFTGTPEGVGMGRNPQRYLRSGEQLISSIEGLGELRNLCV